MATTKCQILLRILPINIHKAQCRSISVYNSRKNFLTASNKSTKLCLKYSLPGRKHFKLCKLVSVSNKNSQLSVKLKLPSHKRADRITYLLTFIKFSLGNLATCHECMYDFPQEPTLAPSYNNTRALCRTCFPRLNPST